MTVHSSSAETDVVVVGAGPYGLSVAAHLLDAGIETRIFGHPMQSWRQNMPRGMYLKSTFDASSLSAPASGSTLADHCAETGQEAPDEFHPVPIELFVDYGLRFQRQFVRTVEEREVSRVGRARGGFRVSVNGDDISARSVVVASGHIAFARLPSELAALKANGNGAAQRVSHSSEHSDFSRFRGRSVAVVGAGQSALESAALLKEAGAEVHLIVRKERILWGGPPSEGPERWSRRILKPTSPMGPGWSLFVLSRIPEVVAHLPPSVRLYLVRTVLGPSGAWWLRKRVGEPIRIRLGTRIESARADDGGITLKLRDQSGSRTDLRVDHVLAATGYRVDVDRMSFIDPELRSAVGRIDGAPAPRLSRFFESSVPGLYFAGLASAPTFGPLMRFVCGTDFAARSIRQRMTWRGRA